MKHVTTLPPKERAAAIAKLVPVLELFAEGKPVNVKVGIARPERTPPQLAYLWAVPIKLLAEAMGFEPPEVHEYACGEHFGWTRDELPGGRFRERPIRTTTTDEHGNRDVLEGDEFWRYVESLQRMGARAGVVIPDPDPSLATRPKRGGWKRVA